MVDMKKVDEVERFFATAGQHIRGGWEGFCLMVLNEDAPNIQVQEMKMAFFAGAAFLFHKITNEVSPDDEITPDDLKLMTQLEDEIQEYAQHIKAEDRHG